MVGLPVAMPLTYVHYLLHKQATCLGGWLKPGKSGCRESEKALTMRNHCNINIYVQFMNIYEYLCASAHKF